jgi:hypothetical protein
MAPTTSPNLNVRLPQDALDALRDPVGDKRFLSASAVVRIRHYYDVGDQDVFVFPTGASAPDTRRAALYCQFKCEEWFGEVSMLSNLGVAALLVAFYGHQQAPRFMDAPTVDMHEDREALACDESAWRELVADPALAREGLQAAMKPYVFG